MSGTPPARQSVFPSRVDLWIAGVITLSYAAGLLAVVQILRVGTAAERLVAMFTLLILAAVGAVAVPVRYRITKRDLLIQSGLRHIRIPLEAIDRVTPSRSLFASPALSMDRLSVRYRSGRFTSPEILISPARQEQFLETLGEAAGLQVRDGALLRVAEDDDSDPQRPVLNRN